MMVELQSKAAAGSPPVPGHGGRGRRVRAALIGAGAIAREHLAALSGMPEVEVAAVCDLSPAIAEMTAERFGARAWYSDYQRMLDVEKPDLVHVTTPPHSHFALTRACLQQGFNVLCEKPITVEHAQFVQLRDLASSSGRLLVENQNLRFHSSIRRILELVASGEFGEVVDAQVQIFLPIGAPGSRFADPNVLHPCLTMRGGAIADFLTHIAYLAYLFTGRPLAVRSAWSKRDAGSILPHDEFRGIVKGERATASVMFSANAQPNGFWVKVLGTRMQAETNLFEPPRLILRRAHGGSSPLTPLLDGFRESYSVLDTSVRGLIRKLAGTSRYDGLPLFIAKTYRALDSRDETPVTLEEIDVIARLVAAFTEPEFTL